jgi:phenylpropionate dioxygenase-like ring-hydroxylating dioxygenase large terminal subunit
MSADDGKPVEQFGLDGEILERMAPKRFEAGAIHGADREMLLGLADRLLKLAPTGRPDEAESFMEIEARQYLDPEIFAHEKRAIFDVTPIVAGFSCDVAKPGDYMKVEGLQSPVFITRTKAGVVKAYINACRHRGAALVYDDRGEGKHSFSCPYHGWTYDSDGKLFGVPCQEAFEGLDKGKYGLIEVPCEEFAGLIFVSPRAEVPLDLDAHLGPELKKQLPHWSFGDTYAARTAPVELPGNWKLVYDTFLEAYHFAAAHKNNLNNYFIGNVSTVDAYGPHNRMAVAYRTMLTEYANQSEEERQPENYMIGSYQLFPGMILISTSQVVEVFRIAPVSVDKTIVYHSCYSRMPLDNEQNKALFEMIWQSAHNIVMNEDFPFGVTTAQRGLESGSLKTLVIGANELAIQNNYKAIAEALAKTK